MEGRLSFLDRDNKRGNVDTSDDSYGTLTIYFSTLPANVKVGCILEFEVKVSATGNTYAKFISVVVPSVDITDDMLKAAIRESNRRDPYINHHFELKYMTPDIRDQIGFLGEFACKELLGLDWRAGIRDNYDVPDDGDILNLNGIVDIKTETVPSNILFNLIRGNISDNQQYGRRLINQDQAALLEHYDYVVWGAFQRPGDYLENLRWYPLGYLETSYILEHYEITKDTPFGTKYPEPCINVRHSELKPIEELKRVLNLSN
ncbi:hypothetical protein [Ruminococcus sp.]|uniref:hypothetical protein n=1 Tax=Ruminococcus sp. TaxID=41978 RepID=UPI002624FD28|nr:hypothetical protein [Ruminococcus sp.]MDD6988327.1 hypothetical protein [Ruminococcus sp.]MDY6201963.1 hypothetical protein [Ruminococcus sp.]